MSNNLRKRRDKMIKYIYVPSAGESVKAVFGEGVVTICGSYRYTTRKEQDGVCKAIVADVDCPEVLKERGWKSLCNEWRAHNLMYQLGIQRERTKDVDFDNEPMWRRIVYTLMSL